MIQIIFCLPLFPPSLPVSCYSHSAVSTLMAHEQGTHPGLLLGEVMTQSIHLPPVEAPCAIHCRGRRQGLCTQHGVQAHSLGQLTLPEQLLNGGPSVWALGRWRPTAQLTQVHHGVHFTCFWGPVSVCRDHESLSGTFRGSALPGYYRTPSHLPASPFLIRQPLETCP